jgi:hypothetical protein
MEKKDATPDRKQPSSLAAFPPPVMRWLERKEEAVIRNEK